MEPQAIQLLDIHRIAYGTGYLELSRVLGIMEVRRQLAVRYMNYSNKLEEEEKEAIIRQIEEYNKSIKKLLSL